MVKEGSFASCFAAVVRVGVRVRQELVWITSGSDFGDG